MLKRFLLLFSALASVLANSPPIFLRNIDLAVIKENTPVGTEFFHLLGSDPENSTIIYRLEGTDRFRVDSNTGIITVAAPIDREINDSLRFYVSLEDVVGSGQDNNVVRVPVTVIVLDENDNEPEFHGMPYKAIVPEDTPVGATIIENIKVTDKDDVGGVLQIRCDFNPQFPNACEKFSVMTQSSSPQSSTASIILRKSLDYTEKENYQLRLIADDGRHNSTAQVSLTVQDVQNRPPVFVGSLTGIVDEDAPVGTLVMTIKANDGDEGDSRNITYDLVTNPEEFFTIHPISGELRTARLLDKEIFPSSNGVINVGIKATEVMSNGALAVGPEASTVAALTITIRDVNDQPPTFNKISYTVNVNENVANGTPFPNLDMFVQDTDSGSNSVFNIELLDDSGIFSVEPSLATGSTSVSIRVANGPLDYENPNQRKFILLVVAKEAFTNPQLSGTGTVTVNILDTNDNVPRFERTEYKASVIENAHAGTVVDTITATDRDTGKFGEAGIHYSIFGNGAEKFHVGETSGVITVAPCLTPGSGNCLDFETRPTYYLSYQAVDELGKGLATVVPLTLSLSDANDNAPAFLHESYSATIDEGALKFDTPLRVQAVDADATSVVQYSIIAGNSHNIFAIDGRSGEISVTQRNGLDVSALKTDQILLTVQASDGGNGVVTTTVKITVKDANNNKPEFQKSMYAATVPESSLPGTVVEQVFATDADTGANAEISYRIQKGGFDDFYINPKSGEITVKSGTKLDYDRRREYNIEIIAVDGGSPTHTGTATLVVNILNSNDKAPYFTPSTQRTQVTEDENVGHIFYTLKAADPDITIPDSLVYAISEPMTATDKDGRQLPVQVSGFKSFFDVIPETGEMRVATRLDREMAAIVSLTVVVTDVSASPPQTGTGTLVVTIIDLNDYPPAFPRPWTPETPEVHINAMEEQPRGSVVATLIATDADSNIAQYLIEPENEYFHIDNISGVISVKNRVDYESIQEVLFKVVAYDTGIPQMSATALVTAKIININDNDPMFDKTSYHATVPENSPQGTSVVEVQAVDADAGDYGIIRYSLLGERSLDFTIDQKGIIRVAAAANLDRETTPSITLQVVATDQGQDVDTRRAISVPLYITLEDRNDNPPLFSQREYVASVVSNLPVSPPSSVIQLSADDKDEGSNAKIVYNIIGGNEKEVFGINEESGVIYPTRELPENIKSFKLKVRAMNPGDESNVDEAIIHVKIVEINQEKPKFIIPATQNATVEIPENQSVPDFLVLIVSAEDKDRGENGRVSYFLKVGDANVEETEHFKINTVTGEIRTKSILDREENSRYQLVLAARDNGSPIAFETLRFLTVILLDIDDNNPEFPRIQTTNPYVFTLEENLPPNFPVGQVRAQDRDIGENALVYYYIVDGNFGGYFQVEKTTGVLKSNASFDREEKDLFEIVVKATSNPDYIVYEREEEQGFSAASRSYREEDLSLALVRITIADVNDNAPKFLSDPYLAGIRTSMQVGDLVATVSATDADVGDNGKFEYRLDTIRLFRPGVTGSVRPVPSPFNISSDGHITASQLMAQYDHARFELKVAAKEVASPFRVAKTTVKVWIYEQNQLVRVIVPQPPEEIHQKKDLIHKILSNATRGVVVIDDIRYHVNEKKKLVRKWTDLYIHVVNNQDEMMLIPQVLEAVDSNSKVLSDRSEFRVHKIVPAYVNLLDEEFDLAMAALITLLVIIFVGIITMIVCCLCLKKWYSVKIHETLTKKNVLIPRDETDNCNTTENPLWTEQKLKLYEEQELSMSVVPDHAAEHQRQQVTAAEVETDAVYATLRKSTRLATFHNQPTNEYATLDGCSTGQTLDIQLDNHEYHELNSRSPSGYTLTSPTSSSPVEEDTQRSTLTIDKDGEPVLITHLE
ncbi:cadherin-87A-like [Uloborus diversus]|uniref:cadherin-87A-like n=1 Tax=Uloborus diversus TaxID=327109 RepID=UPI002409BFD0|nr:cadherin-87A-like [Uloborus diversus]